MYPVSEEFLSAVQENTRKYEWSGKITTVKGIVYEFTSKDIVKGSGYITRSCCGNNEVELGSVYASEMKITLFLDVDRYSMEDAIVELYYSLALPNGNKETIPMGIFEISEANRHIKTIELVGYDYMLRFEKSASDMTSGYPYDFLTFACEKCKVELAHTKEEIESMPNGKELLGVYQDGNIETYRDMIFYVAQVLGRVCQINREGKLELKAYGAEPVVTMEAKHRFSSSYSDFVTRYTAVYSTNEVDAISEYYCLDPDDGLTMNLGVNPLLQYGLVNTREVVITNILNAISVINYVPFDSDTIGNPALEPMDVVKFTGGHADDDSISCITSVTYKINGKQTLKGVGKNPLLSSAKSKADKNIIRLLNQVETGKFVICAYENASELMIGADAIRIIDVTFAAIESTSALFIGNINCMVSAEEETVTKEYNVSHEVPMVDSIISRAVAIAKEEIAEENAAEEGTEVVEEGTGDEGTEESTIPEVEYEVTESVINFPVTQKVSPIVTFLYKLDDTWVEDYKPKQKVVDGENILSLLFPMGSLGANSAKRLEVYMLIEGGELVIAPANCKAAVAGSGIASGYTEWDGKIVIEEQISVFTLPNAVMTMKGLSSDTGFSFCTDMIGGTGDMVGRYSITGAMTLLGLSESIEAAEEVVES
uniref:hypothetical protein n=1 Tax=Acetatifactor sp. TaxID=1872090 RepID=UPI0040561DE3